MRRRRRRPRLAGCTGAWLWQTRVVTRSSTGIFQRSEISIAGEREIVGFLRVGGLQHRHARGHGVMAIVLFVLA